MGQVVPIGDDYSTPCGVTPKTFIEMLSRCMVVYGDHVYINVIGATGWCDTLTSFWTCDNNGTEPERALVENSFALDECDNLALKMFLNAGSGV